MNRKLALSIFLIILFASMLNVCLRVQKARANGTIYIRATGEVEGTDKIQRNGDVYTFTDDINDSIVVERNNTILDGAGHTLQGSGSGNGFNLIGVSNVTIMGVQIKTFENGIWLNCSSNNNITENSVEDNKRGIFLYTYSNLNSIAENKITANYMSGVLLFRSSNNSITGNNITANKYEGIMFEYSLNNTVAGNSITVNAWEGILLHVSSNNTIIRNGIKTNGDHGVLFDYYSNHNNIVGNNITNSHGGIYFNTYSNFNNIVGNNITANESGIYLSQASNNSIHENNVTDNDLGIQLHDSSNNSIYHNSFVNNKRQVYDYSWNSSYINPSVNKWDDGYPSGGNYWSDYQEKYPNATEIDNSDIWNTPYVIDENNQDNYPIVPEFPSALIMPLFMIATLLAVTVYGRKQCN